MVGADRTAISGDDIVLEDGTAPAACLNAVDALQMRTPANSIQAPDIAGLVGALLRIELAQYAIH